MDLTAPLIFPGCEKASPALIDSIVKLLAYKNQTPEDFFIEALEEHVVREGIYINNILDK